MPSTSALGFEQLLALARAQAGSPRLPCCANIRAAGWESLPSSFESRQLRLAGSLRDPDIDAPQLLAEYHPRGSNLWSADAPIAPLYFPNNQSEAWTCVSCGRAFLRYTEAGGYYQEERIRELDPSLLVDAAPP